MCPNEHHASGGNNSHFAYQCKAGDHYKNMKRVFRKAENLSRSRVSLPQGEKFGYGPRLRDYIIDQLEEVDLNKVKGETLDEKLDHLAGIISDAVNDNLLQVPAQACPYREVYTLLSEVTDVPVFGYLYHQAFYNGYIGDFDKQKRVPLYNTAHPAQKVPFEREMTQALSPFKPSQNRVQPNPKEDVEMESLVDKNRKKID